MEAAFQPPRRPARHSHFLHFGYVCVCVCDHYDNAHMPLSGRKAGVATHRSRLSTDNVVASPFAEEGKMEKEMCVYLSFYTGELDVQ